MSASRSRNTDWQKSLQQVLDRRGALELAVARHESASEDGVDIIWRSQLIALHDEFIEVESPQALGRTDHHLAVQHHCAPAGEKSV